MFGTIARLNVKPGHRQAVVDLFDEWSREFRPRVQGAIAGYLYQSANGSDTYTMVVAFADRESYYANAETSGQNEWYQRLREHLASDPEWADGEVIAHWGA